jgi:phage I-like protein
MIRYIIEYEDKRDNRRDFVVKKTKNGAIDFMKELLTLGLANILRPGGEGWHKEENYKLVSVLEVDILDEWDTVALENQIREERV